MPRTDSLAPDMPDAADIWELIDWLLIPYPEVWREVIRKRAQVEIAAHDAELIRRCLRG